MDSSTQSRSLEPPKPMEVLKNAKPKIKRKQSALPKRPGSSGSVWTTHG